MKMHVNFSDFLDSFSETYKNNFTYEGKRALFDYLEELEESIGEEIELDAIALCCKYSEYETALECAKDHGYDEVVDLDPIGSVDLLEVAELEERQALEWLEDKTTVIKMENGGVIVQQF